MNMKDCMFQYGTKHTMLADTDLITLPEAMFLFNKNRENFIKRLENDEDPQMAVWIECATPQSYDKTLHNWYAEDFKVIDGQLYQAV